MRHYQPEALKILLSKSKNSGRPGLSMMNLFPRLQTSFLSWSHGTPLPASNIDTTTTFQTWHSFDRTSLKWVEVKSPSTEGGKTITGPQQTRIGTSLTLVTWNVDAGAPLPEDRIAGVVSHIESLEPKVDIIFFQEVSRKAFRSLLDQERIRASWFSSEKDTSVWKDQAFATVTLLSKARFATGEGAGGGLRIGPIWRTALPSRFGRDALCCDILVSASDATDSTSNTGMARIRLANVHLDSLPIQPSQRPRQAAIVASILRSAGSGIIAGDFNPVLEEDGALISDNGLTDAWAELHPDEPGFTWGIDGEQPFPPNRLDKVALIGLLPQEIRVLETKLVMEPVHKEDDGQDSRGTKQQRLPTYDNPAWSDHCGLVCSFKLPGRRATSLDSKTLINHEKEAGLATPK